MRNSIGTFGRELRMPRIRKIQNVDAEIRTRVGRLQAFQNIVFQVGNEEGTSPSQPSTHGNHRHNVPFGLRDFLDLIKLPLVVHIPDGMSLSSA